MQFSHIVQPDTAEQMCAEILRARRIACYGVGREGLMMKGRVHAPDALGLDAHQSDRGTCQLRTRYTNHSDSRLEKQTAKDLGRQSIGAILESSALDVFGQPL